MFDFIGNSYDNAMSDNENETFTNIYQSSSEEEMEEEEAEK